MPPRLKRYLGMLGCVLATFYAASQLFVLLATLTATAQPATSGGSSVQVSGYPLPVQVLLLALGCVAIYACARLATPRPTPTDTPTANDTLQAQLAALLAQQAASSPDAADTPNPSTAPSETPAVQVLAAMQQVSAIELETNSTTADNKQEPPGGAGGSESVTS